MPLEHNADVLASVLMDIEFFLSDFSHRAANAVIRHNTEGFQIVEKEVLRILRTGHDLGNVKELLKLYVTLVTRMHKNILDIYGAEGYKADTDSRFKSSGKDYTIVFDKHAYSHMDYVNTGRFFMEMFLSSIQQGGHGDDLIGIFEGTED